MQAGANTHFLLPCHHPINQSTKTDTQSAIQSVSQPPKSSSQSDAQSVSQSAVWAGWRLRRRALCLSREVPDTTVAGRGPSQWPSTQRPTHWDNGSGSEWGWTAELRLPTCTLQDRTHLPPSPLTHTHIGLTPSSFKELLQVSSCICGTRRKQEDAMQRKRSFGFHSKRCTMTEAETCAVKLLRVKGRLDAD